MAKAPTLAQIVAKLTEWHAPFHVYSGAETRSRPGGLADLVGLINHHTGGGSASASYLYFLAVTGRPAEGIPGPLCDVATDMGGTVHILATGRANHAGSGSSTTLARVRAESYPGYSGELKPGPDNINGNPVYLGNEIIYSGTRPPTAAQYRGAVLWNVAMIDLLRWTALSVISHREHTRRKDDPFGIDMAAMRVECRRVHAAGPKATTTYVATGNLTLPAGSGKPPTQTPPVTEEDDMPWTEAQLRAMMQAENEEYAVRFWIAPSGTGTALRNLVTKISNQLDTMQGSAANLALTSELHGALEASVNDLDARPAAAELQHFLNVDGTMDPLHVITDAAPSAAEKGHTP